MAGANAVWGIDVGQCALKALKLRPADGGLVEVVAFDVIEHPKILSQPDADREELVASALEKFTSRNDWQGDQFIVGVPGQQTFARFCKMPPLDLKKDAKKIPDLVRYEASQQIPFDMEDVVWDYQVFTSEGSPDVEVGIFAIRKDLIRKHLGYFADVGIAPAGVQTVPAALYNFCQFDGLAAGEGGATVVIDVGAQNTDLIIVEPNAAWTRNIPLGGNSFTEALVRAFKLSFAKAESLKRSAATSKYARQIFQAMRPVFAELVAEIQRSIGFYSSTHRDVELRKVLALGNAFRLPGLQKYLENNLTISGGVAKLEKFAKVVPTATVNAPQFTDNILSFAAAYGLALQGLGLGKIRATLLPAELARVAVWKKKRPYFIAAAASLAVAAVVPLAADTLDRQTLNSRAAEDARRAYTEIIQRANSLVARYEQARSDTTGREAQIQSVRNLQKDKLILPRLLSLVHEALPPVYPPELAQVRDGAELKEKIQSDPARYPRTRRGQFLIESFNVEYAPNVEKHTLAGAQPSGGAAPGAGMGMPMGRGLPPGMMGPGGMMMPGRGGMMYGMGGPPMGGPPAGGEGAAAETPESPGFIVRVQGRLLFGERASDASAWLWNEYLENLRELSRRPGLGFYIPDPPKEGDNRPFEVLSLTLYHQDASAGMIGRGGAGPGTTAPPGTGGEAKPNVKFPDPVTGEEMATDWRAEIAFKVRLGEPPAEPAAGSPAGPVPGMPPRQP